MKKINYKANKKGQIISITAFFVIVLAIFILATILMSFVNTILNPVQSSLGEISNQSGSTIGKVATSFNTWWDYAIIILFFLNVIILFISSYQVDTHPIFLVLYIISVMILVIFGGNIVSSLSSIWASDGYFGTGNVSAGGNAVQYMPLTQFILNNFTMILLGIIILSGIIMYSKFKFSQGGGVNY